MKQLLFFFAFPLSVFIGAKSGAKAYEKLTVIGYKPSYFVGQNQVVLDSIIQDTTEFKKQNTWFVARKHNFIQISKIN
jgi:hypothetical protein